jgi:hypothetical protein
MPKASVSIPKKNPDIAHAEQSNRQRNRGRCQNDGNEHEFERLESEAGHHSGAVGANTEKHCMTERQKAGVAKQQIEAEQCDGIAEERDHQADVVGRHDEGQQRKRHRAHECDRKRALHACALPNRPAGRKIRTPITMT